MTATDKLIHPLTARLLPNLLPRKVELADQIVRKAIGEEKDAQHAEWLFECIASVSRAFDEYRDSKDPVSAAFALTVLNDRVSDLKTYHPGYDVETGRMPYDQ